MNPKTLLVIAALVVAVSAVIGILAWVATRKAAQRSIEREGRANFIDGYEFPPELSQRVHVLHPQFTHDQVGMVMDGLRQYFLACLGAQTHGIAKQCGMPSKAVDDAWHEFILMSRDYESFCRQAFGSYLHHTPQEQSVEPMRDSVANTLHQFRGAPVGPAGWAMAGTIPLLFAIDRQLGIADGFHHDPESLDALDTRRVALQAQANSAAHGSGAESIGSDNGPSCDAVGGSSCDGGGGGGCSGGGCGSG